jgi:phage terminase large subunit-like protein
MRSPVLLDPEQAFGSVRIDPLMAEFNAIALMSTNPRSARPNVQVNLNV